MDVSKEVPIDGPVTDRHAPATDNVTTWTLAEVLTNALLKEKTHADPTQRDTWAKSHMYLPILMHGGAGMTPCARPPRCSRL